MNINSRTSKINFTGFASGTIASFTGLRAAPTKVKVNAIGVSECNVVRCGKNLFNDTTGTHTINANTATTLLIGEVYLEANITYTISCKQTPAPLTSFLRNTLLVIGGGTTTYNSAGNDYTIKPMTFTPTVSDTYNIMVWGHTLSATTTYSEFQVEEGSTATAYEAYTGNTYTIPTNEFIQIEQIIGINNIFVDDENVNDGTVEVYYVTI